jgi:hypothetical protein
VAWWSGLVAVFGTDLLALWLIVNFLLFLTSILPHSGNYAGQPYRSDGLSLWEIPRASAEQLDLYRSSALLMRGLSLFNARDYARSKAIAERLLERVPDSNFARIMISASTSNLGDHRRTLDVLAPVSRSIDSLDAATRAVVRNNAAFAHAMSSAALRVEEPLQEAERLSADAFSAYPCVLAYRNTRALVLAAIGRESEALELLRYVNYESASAVDVGVHAERIPLLHAIDAVRQRHQCARSARPTDKARLASKIFRGFSPGFAFLP